MWEAVHDVLRFKGTRAAPLGSGSLLPAECAEKTASTTQITLVEILYFKAEILTNVTRAYNVVLHDTRKAASKRKVDMV